MIPSVPYPHFTYKEVIMSTDTAVLVTVPGTSIPVGAAEALLTPLERFAYEAKCTGAVLTSMILSSASALIQSLLDGTTVEEIEEQGFTSDLINSLVASLSRLSEVASSEMEGVEDQDKVRRLTRIAFSTLAAALMIREAFFGTEEESQ